MWQVSLGRHEEHGMRNHAIAEEVSSADTGQVPESSLWNEMWLKNMSLKLCAIFLHSFLFTLDTTSDQQCPKESQNNGTFGGPE